MNLRLKSGQPGCTPRWLMPRHQYPVIATARLRLRPFVLSDISALVSSVTQRRIADATLAVPQPFDAPQARRWIASHARSWQEHAAAHWAIATPENDRLVGYVGLHDICGPRGQADLSLWIAERLERKDLGIEAAHAALAFAFADLQLGRVQAHQVVGNPLLARILRRIGMKPKTAVRHSLSRWGRTDEGWIWSIARCDWMGPLQDAAAH